MVAAIGSELRKPVFHFAGLFLPGTAHGPGNIAADAYKGGAIFPL